jgi:exodeoxyribonuclease V alpha subunit
MNANLQTLVRNGWLRRVDAALGDWIARAFPESAPEVALAAAIAAHTVNEGHSALQLDAVQTWLAGFDGRGEVPALPDAAAWHDLLRESEAVHPATANETVERKPLVLDRQGRVYLRRYYGYEHRLARDLIARARTERLNVITGGPGTGKTHGVVRMLAALAEEAHARERTLRIALAAPTGKAAARLAQSVRAQLPQLALPDAIAETIPRDAFTLHRLLGLSPNRAGAKFHRNLPLPFDVVVVDEVSMVDLPLMVKLADAVREDAMLILLGDPDQLSAVEAGDVLGALVDAARAPPLSHCHTHLTQSHRFAADSPLRRLASAVVGDEANAALAILQAGGEIRLVDDDNHHAQLIGHAVGAYRAILDAHGPARALQAANRFRVLTALRQGPSGSLALDRVIEQRLKRHAGVRADAQWWRGRLLMVTSNRAELNLFNGDVGVVWPDAAGDPKIWFEGADGAPRAISPAALPSFEGAFALTVHKAQGSEFDEVALVLGADTKVLTRELLYTGVTRARSVLHIYGDETLLRAGIARRTQRWNGLADRLREAAAAPTSIAESLPHTT